MLSDGEGGKGGGAERVGLCACVCVRTNEFQVYRTRRQKPRNRRGNKRRRSGNDTRVSALTSFNGATGPGDSSARVRTGSILVCGL